MSVPRVNTISKLLRLGFRDFNNVGRGIIIDGGKISSNMLSIVKLFLVCTMPQKKAKTFEFRHQLLI